MLTDALKDEIRAAYARLKAELPGFRARPAQGRMIAEVAKTLTQAGGAALIEAPTGTGKSIAYLVAGVAAARAQQKQLVIATATIALQEQLVTRDIPLYLKLTGTTAKVALAKGRGRYLCPRNLSLVHGVQASGQTSLAGLEDESTLWPKPPKPQDRAALDSLSQAYIEGEWDGDLDQAPTIPGELLRNLLTTSAGGCTGRRCGSFTRCPFFSARRTAADAQIIVANQDLVLSDLTMPRDEDHYGGVILPKPEDSLYIFDEAHHLPAKAIERGAVEVPLTTALRQINRLGRQVHAAYSLTDKERLGRLDLTAGDKRLAEYSEALEALERMLKLDWTPADSEDRPIWRASLGQLPEAWRKQAEVLHGLSRELSRWLSAVRRAVLELHVGGPTQEALARELGLALERLERQVRTWQAWTQEDSENAPPLARWISLGPGAERIWLCHACAVSAGPLLQRVLWESAGAAVMTSATLSAGGQFRAFADAVGLPSEATSVSLPSPFDLAAQARLEVPALRSLPENREAHAQEICDWLASELDWQAGNLVLFTSRAKLERVLQKLPLEQLRKVRVQGTAGKQQLIDEHIACIESGQGSTLFGLASFGEGLDLPGRLCETVVITQLPFAVPTDPVGATYAEWLESRGRNPFLEVAIPEATRTLIQYCGRLIRSETDRGRIVLLDRRVVLKHYGQRMLHALPPFTRTIAYD